MLSSSTPGYDSCIMEYDSCSPPCSRFSARSSHAMDHASGASSPASAECMSKVQEFDEQGRIDSYPGFHYDVLEIGYPL
jgi:hypothetical protein